MGLTGFVRVLLGFTGFVRVLLGLTWSFRVLEWAKLPTCIRAWKGSGTQHFSRIWRAVPCCLFFFDNFFVVFFFTASRAKEQRTSEPTNPPASATNDEGKELINKWIIKGKKRAKTKRCFLAIRQWRPFFSGARFRPAPTLSGPKFLFLFFGFILLWNRDILRNVSHMDRRLDRRRTFFFFLQICFYFAFICWASESFFDLYRIVTRVAMLVFFVDFTGFCSFFPCFFYGFERVLNRSSKGFYWIILGYTRVLLGFTGVNWVWLGFTGFYWFFMGFTRFY